MFAEFIIRSVGLIEPELPPTILRNFLIGFLGLLTLISGKLIEHNLEKPAHITLIGILILIALSVIYIGATALKEGIKNISDHVIINSIKVFLYRITHFWLVVVIFQVSLIQVSINLIGIISAIILSAYGMLNIYVPLILVLGTGCLILFFAWFGTKVERIIRWKHLFSVAIGVVIVTIGFAYAVDSRSAWDTMVLGVLFACVQTFGAMSVGGYIANKVKPDLNNKTIEAFSESPVEHI